MTDEFEFTSRYDVTGPPNGCKGPCEGTGVFPQYERCPVTATQAVQPVDDASDDPPIYRVLWYLAEARHQTDDGYHFIPCPDCSPDPLVALARQFLRGPHV